MLKFIKKIVGLSLFITFIAVSILVFQMLRFHYGNLKIQGEEQVFFLIKSGSNIKTIAQQLSLEKIIEDPWLFILLAKIKGVETKVKAGEYLLTSSLTPGDMLSIFTIGNSVQYSLTIIEGWSFKQMMQEIKNSPIIISTLDNKSYGEIMRLIGLGDVHFEGQFYPDTYQFPKGTTDIDFLRRANQLMQKHLTAEWNKRAPNLPLKTSYEALILASIIEKETGVGYERPLIAGVFIERLKRKMRLQTDPTVIYGMGDQYQGNIRYRDLKTDTPYNTYVHKGLTPTPIALPGLDSIHAALHPAETKALYFVAKGDGTHHFSETLEDHNRAVLKYQLKGKKKKTSSTINN